VDNPVSVASCLFDSSVHGKVTLVHSIVGAATFELDAHLEGKNVPPQTYGHYLYHLISCYLPLIHLSSVLFCEPENIEFHLGFL